MINDNFSTAALSTHSELACSEAISQPSAQFSAALHLNRVLECGAIIDMGIQEELALPSKAWKKICQSLNTLL